MLLLFIVSGLALEALGLAWCFRMRRRYKLAVAGIDRSNRPPPPPEIVWTLLAVNLGSLAFWACVCLITHPELAS